MVYLCKHTPSPREHSGQMWVRFRTQEQCEEALAHLQSWDIGAEMARQNYFGEGGGKKRNTPSPVLFVRDVDKALII